MLFTEENAAADRRENKKNRSDKFSETIILGVNNLSIVAGMDLCLK